MLVWICNPDLSIVDFQSTGTTLNLMMDEVTNPD